MRAEIKDAAKRLCRHLGFDVNRVRPWREYEWVRKHDIGTVLDVGANTGQFASYIHTLLPNARIYSFEPLADCYGELVRRMGNVPGFRAFNLALGDTNGTAMMQRNEFSPSSSLLSMETLHKNAFPHTERTQTEEVQIRRLDELKGDIEIVDNVLIKMDVQGSEDKVIKGGRELMPRASVLIIETTFYPLYQGQALFDDIYDMLRQDGFVFMGCEGAIRDPRDGVILQCDSIFLRAAEIVGRAGTTA
jgi:FkbM family methyltransferase